MSARSRSGGGGTGTVQDLLAEAQSFMEAGKYGKAASALKKILAKDSEHWEALRLSATLNLKLGSLFAARSAFEALARKAIESRDHLIAQSLLKEYLAVVPRYIPFLEMLGQVFEATGSTTGALVEYGKALSFIRESEDPEHKSRGVHLYRRVKALDPDGPIVRKLSETYRVEAEALDAAESQASSSSVFPAPAGIGLGAPPDGTDSPWRGQEEPAPFPWEVADRPIQTSSRPGVHDPAALPTAERSPPPSPSQTAEPSPPAEPAAPSDAPAPPGGGLRFAAGPAAAPETETSPTEGPESVGPSAEAVEPPVMAEPEAPGLHGETGAQEGPEPTAEPVAPEPTPMMSSTGTAATDTWEETAGVRGDEASQGVVPLSDEPLPGQEPETSPEPPPSYPAEEPAPAPKSRSFFGLRMRSGSAQDVEPREEAGETAPKDSPTGGWFDDITSGGTSDADQALAPPSLHEDSHPSPEPRAKRRGRRGGAGSSAPTAPTWAAPPAPGESQSTAPPQLFPTAAKFKFKLTIFSRRALSAIRSLAVLTVLLATVCLVLGILAVGGLSMVWIGTEEKPSNAFYNLMKLPTPPLLDRRQNGYLTLLSIGTSSDRKPVRMGERRSVLSTDPTTWPEGFADLAAALSSWYGTWDPADEFEKQRNAIRQWSAFFGAQMARYHKWVASPIEDVGFASLEAPDEGMVLGIHRLYVAEGFSEGVARGIGRLQRDLETWRHALAQAKSLRFKMLALEALNDDLIVMSGLLARPELDLTLLPTLARMSRPMDHAERSLRWPMQNQFALEMEMVKSYLRTRGDADSRPDYVKALTFFPLPKQKIFNAHAVYFEGLVKHDSMLKLDGDTRKQIPQRYDQTSAPPQTLSDYIANPIDNLLVTEDRVDWHDIIGRVLETEARLRLGSLQVHIRRPPATTQPLTRIANAGQDFYDPFTGFTMLMNGTKTILYCVGRNGEDDDGDLTLDVSVPLTRQGT